MLTRSSRLTGDLSVTWLPAGEVSVIHSIHTPWHWQTVYSTTCMIKDIHVSITCWNCPGPQISHVSIFDTISVKTGSCCPSRSGLILYQGQSWGGPQVRSIIKDEQQPTALRFADSRMWIVLTSVSSSTLLPQSFTLGPSPLGCPPYYVNYDPITTSLQIRSPYWPWESLLSWYLKHAKGRTQALCTLVWVFSCVKTEKLACFSHPRLEGVTAGTMLHLPAPGWENNSHKLHLCPYKY